MQREIEIAKEEGINLCKHINPKMTGKEVRDIRLNLLAKKALGKDV